MIGVPIFIGTNMPAPAIRRDEDIVHAIRDNRNTYDVGSPYPGGGEATKGLAVRQLKGYASWVQTVARQVGPYLVWALKFEEGCP